MYNEKNPHIVSTENMMFIDENGNVIPNPYDTGYDEPIEVSLKRRIGILEGEETKLLEKLAAFRERPDFTEKQRKLIAAYLKDERATSFLRRIKYRSIREVFIEPYARLLRELERVRRELGEFRYRYLLKTR